MAIFSFDDYDKKKRTQITPSQKAREQVKSDIEKKNTEGVFNFSDFETFKSSRPTPAPVQPTPQPQQKTAFQKVGDFVKDSFNAIKGIQKPSGVTLDNLFDFSTVPFLEKTKVDIQNRMDEIYTKPTLTDKDQKKLSKLSRQYDKVNSLSSGSSLDRLMNSKYIANLITERSLKNVAADFLSSSASVSKFISWKADYKDKEGVAKAARSTTDKLEEWAGAVRPTNPDLADAIAGGFGSVGFFFIPGVGTARGAAMLAKVSPKLALIFGQSASSSLEASAEAGDVYETLIEQGKTKEEANNGANNTFWANVGLNIILDRFGLLSEGRRLRVLKTGTAEGVQEMSQAVISNLNTGRPYDEGLIESGIVGAVTGGAVGGMTDPRRIVGLPSENIPRSVLREQIDKYKEEQAKAKPEPPIPQVIKDEMKTKESKIFHGGQRTQEQVVEDGFRVSRNASENLGQAIYFTDNQQFAKDFGDKVTTLDPSQFNLKEIGTLEQQEQFVKDMKAKDLSEAISKEGKFDGFVIRNPDPDVGTTYGITNVEKANQIVRGQEVKSVDQVKTETGRVVVDPSKIVKQVLPPGTMGNPSNKWEAQIRYKGFAADKMAFNTKSEAENFLKDYKFEGLKESVSEDYKGTRIDPFQRQEKQEVKKVEEKKEEKSPQPSRKVETLIQEARKYGSAVEELNTTGKTKISNGNSDARIKTKTITAGVKTYDAWEVEAIVSKKAKTGSATELINQIKELANQNNKLVILKDTPSSRSSYKGVPKSQIPESPMSQSALTKWYEKNGFKRMPLADGSPSDTMFYFGKQNKSPLYNQAIKKAEPKPVKAEPKEVEKPKTTKEVRLTKVTVKPQSIDKSIQPNKLKSYVKKSSLPILTTGKVSNGKMTFTNLDSFIEFDTKLQDGMYDVIGKEFVAEKTFDPKDYPEIPSIKNKVGTIDADKLRSVVAEVGKFSSTDETRPVLTGVIFNTNQGGTDVMATDGYRLLQRTLPLKSSKPETFNLIAKDLKPLVSMIPSGKVEVKMSDDMVMFDGQGVRVGFRKIKGDYPQVDKILPKEINVQYKIDKNQYKEAIKSLAPFAKESENSINHIPGEKSIILEAGKGDKVKTIELPYKLIPGKVKYPGLQDSSIVMPLRGKQDEKSVSLNYKYMEDIISTTDGDSMFLSIDAEKTLGKSPVYISNKEAKKSTRVSSRGSMADFGGYATIEQANEATKTINAVQFPELVRIARQVTGSLPGVQKFRVRKTGQPRGVFYSAGNGLIKLSPEIFSDPMSAAKTLAHEMGHMADYFEDKTLARGNLIGRIASLNKFMAKTFSTMENQQKIDQLTRERKGLTEERKSYELGTSQNKSLLKRIKSLNKQIKEIKSKATYKQDVLHQELKELSKMWKPFDETQVPQEYIEYRYSSPELYADAISVLFNDPQLLKDKAPTFWKGFFENINKKPTIAKNFYSIWDLLYRGEGEVLDQRAKDIRDMFEKGEDKVLAMVKERQAREEDYVFKLKFELFNENQRIVDKIKQLKKEGKFVSDESNPQFMLEEHSYTGGLIKNWVETNISPIYKDFKDNGVTWEDFGEVLFHERVINERGAVNNILEHIKENSPAYESIKDEIPQGLEKKSNEEQLSWLKEKYGKTMSEDGKSLYSELLSTLPRGIANPLGYDRQTSTKQLEYLKKNLGDKWAVIERNLSQFRKAINEITLEAEKEGFYRPEMIKQMKANPAYATFQVVDYMDLHIPATIKQQVGTLKEVANPANSTIIKTISIMKAIERNKAKKSVVNFLKENFSSEISDARTVFNGKTSTPIEPKSKDLELYTVIEDGKYKGYYIDPYIAHSMNKMSTGSVNAVLGTLRFFNNKLFRPLFITFNVGFQSFNLFRDFTRFYKNTPGMSLFGAFYRYYQALPAARRRAFGIPDKTISEMEKSKILGITYNDVVKGFSEQDKQIDFELAKIGLSPLKGKKTNALIKPFKAVLDFIENTGNLIETIPKVAAYKELNGQLPPKELGQFIRTSVGSPDFLRRGAGYRWYNEVFLFSNAIKEGLMTDFDVAFRNPRTRSGYWLKTVQVSLLPKTLMFAALAGAFGDKIKELFEKVSDYDMTSYTIVPLGETKDGKAIILRIPQDETGRLFAGLYWKMLRIATGKKLKMGDLADLADYAGGQAAPSLTPIFSAIYGITTFAAGQNPYDFFRGRNVIPDAEFKAGGAHALKPFVIWQLNQLGLGTVMKTYYSTQPPADREWYQKTVDAPILSNIIGRWIKFTDQGVTESNRKIVEEIETLSAKDRLIERNKINEAIKEFRSGDMTEARKRDMARKLVEEIMDDPRSDKTRATNIQKKFRIGVIKGDADPNVNSLIYATTNEQKVALLQSMSKTMSDRQMREMMRKLMDEKIISINVVKEFQKR